MEAQDQDCEMLKIYFQYKLDLFHTISIIVLPITVIFIKTVFKYVVD